ncbi:MAG TPA: MBL fold metallo-hydrolase [Kineosporiaceae bacterium]|nr:MBL fold metallo-hydrolase [Kineosporiaceae bacterium]
MHSHPHGDHIAGDLQFTDRPDTEVIDARLSSAWTYFGFDADPEQVATVDLGGRVLECLASPEHHPAAVTFHDRLTGLLFTGDTVYPGRLYVQDWTAFPHHRTPDHQLRHVRDVLDEVGDRPGRYPFADFVICRADG